MEFKYEPNRIYLEEGNKVIAEITFPLNGDEATIDHTFVDESLRGQGIASKLVELAVKKIRENGWKLNATCPYAVNWIKKNI